MTTTVVLLCATVSCVNDTTSSSKNYYNEFIAENNIMAVANGEVVKSYSKENDQVIYNDDRTLFMLSDMNYTTQYTLTVSGEIVLDNVVTINYKSNIGESLSSGSCAMTVVKADEDDSRYWLWDSEGNIGFIVDFSF